MVEETAVSKKQKHAAKPQVTGDFLICLGRDSNPGSGERQLEVIGNALDHTAIRAGQTLLGLG